MLQFRGPRISRRLFAILCPSVLLVCGLGTAQQQHPHSSQGADSSSPTQMAVVTRIGCQSTGPPIRVRIEFDRPVQYHSNLLQRPDRLYFDFDRTQPAENLRLTEFSACRGLIPKVRVAEHEPGVTRVVLYFSQKLSYEVANSTIPAGITVLMRIGELGPATPLMGMESKLTDDKRPPAAAQNLTAVPSRPASQPSTAKVAVRQKALAPVASAELPNPPHPVADLIATLDRAEKGDPEAQASLGRAHESGEVLAVNYRQALRWYNRAAVQGNVYAALRLGDMYANGVGTEPNVAEARYWYRSVASRSLLARRKLQELSKVGVPTERHAVTPNSGDSSAGVGHADAQSTSHKPSFVKPEESQPAAAITTSLRGGITATHLPTALPEPLPQTQPSDDTLSLSLLPDQVLRLRRPAPYFRASLVLADVAQPPQTATPVPRTSKANFGFDTAEAPSDPVAATKWYLQAAQKGIPQAQYGVAIRYLEGKGIGKDLGIAARWFRRAAEQGHAAAQNNLGMLYLNGWGVQASTAEARKWFERSARAGEAGGQQNLGAMYINGRGVPVNYLEGSKWVRKAADQGLPQAAYTLGTLYMNGRGVPREPSTAIDWLRRAAIEGHARAQLILGEICLSGHVILRDYGEGRKWLERAAAQGLPEAEVAMARIYREGLGVNRNGQEAIAWLSKAANRRYAEAQYALGQMYAEGKSIPADPVLAYAWFAVAASNGQRVGLTSINNIAPHMTIVQIAEAQKQAYLLAGKIATTSSSRKQ